ncbi:FAD-dependent oxidoreductase [Streptomyces marincola]|nr:FAD-dependent oxidoreductase [Streptomyces marincola]
MSYWMETAPAAPRPRLDADTSTDVAVVGAGIAGLATAWELARAGREVVVLEADRVAAGVSGHTTAKLSALHTLVYDRLRRTRGPEGAMLYAQSQQDAVEHVADVAAELGADCELEGRPAFTWADDPKGVDALRAEALAAEEAGLDASFVTTTGLPFPVAGAVRVEGQAQFHPRRYLLALAADLAARGGRVFEHTRVTDLDEGDTCRLTTEHGAVVTARHVVVATHYPVFDRALAFARLAVHRELVVAGPVRAADDPGGMFITPEGSRRSVRTAPLPDGRRLLIVTGESHTPGTGDAPAAYERLESWTRERFPGVEITHRWAAQDTDPPDLVPLVGHLRPGTRNVWVATGFGGWGMSGGVMAGRLLAARITGGELPWQDLYAPVPGVREAPALLKNQANAARHFVGDRLRSGRERDVADLAPGTGAVLRLDGHPCAVHRAGDGTVRAVSARCTHLGCLVAFNEAEQTWECPCHGSRFSPDGSVLQGPATEPLAPREPAPRPPGPGDGASGG